MDVANGRSNTVEEKKPSFVEKFVIHKKLKAIDLRHQRVGFRSVLDLGEHFFSCPRAKWYAKNLVTIWFLRDERDIGRVEVAHENIHLGWVVRPDVVFPRLAGC